MTITSTQPMSAANAIASVSTTTPPNTGFPSAFAATDYGGTYPSLNVYVGPPVPTQAGVYLTTASGSQLSFTVSRYYMGAIQPLMSNDQCGLQGGQGARLLTISGGDSVSVMLRSFTSGALTLSKVEL